MLEGDSMGMLRGAALADRSIGVYYYVAAHHYESQLEPLRVDEPYLADPALVIVDDSDWDRVARAIDDYLAGQPRARLLLEIKGSGHGLPQWWEGMQVLAWGRDLGRALRCDALDDPGFEEQDAEPDQRTEAGKAEAETRKRRRSPADGSHLRVSERARGDQ